MILGRLYLLLKGKLGIDTAVLVSDRYDVTHSKKQFERARSQTIRDGIVASYKTSGKHTVPNYHKSLRHPSNKAAVAEFNSIYTLETAPKLLNDQSILLVGVFKMVHMQCAHNAAITGEKDLYSSQEEADIRMLLPLTNVLLPVMIQMSSFCLCSITVKKKMLPQLKYMEKNTPTGVGLCLSMPFVQSHRFPYGKHYLQWMH